MQLMVPYDSEEEKEECTHNFTAGPRLIETEIARLESDKSG